MPRIIAPASSSRKFAIAEIDFAQTSSGDQGAKDLKRKTALSGAGSS
jgi:hypothetical protein